MPVRISVDVGGTFTDLLVADDQGIKGIFKSPTTTSDPKIGVLNAVKLAAGELGESTEALLGRCAFFIHGTTVATNALIQSKTAKTGLLCTAGHRHILFYRDAGKKEPYNLRLDYPEPLIPTYLTLPVTERLNSEGGIEVPLDEETVRAAIRQFKEWDVEAIAVCLLWSIVNPAHERRIAEIIKEEWPEVAYSISNEVQPLIREYHRTCATAIDASLKPLISDYVESLQGSLAAGGLKNQFFMVASNGGVMSASESTKRPVYTVNSGPAMGPLAGKLSGQTVGVDNVLVVDMGGTSFDVSTVIDGLLPVSREQKVGADPLGIIAVEVNTLGAGGGSIAWIDPGGMLCVGPQSAGADPGPACYDMGGKAPTVTDANVVLGYINPDNFLGGRKKLKSALSAKAIRKDVAKPLGLALEEGAAAIVRVVEEKMFSGIEDITVRRGIDPREFMLVAGGGAGPVHAASLAGEIGIKQVLIPKEATALCAYGMMASDIKIENAITHYTDTAAFDFDGVNAILKRLEDAGRQTLADEGVAQKNIKFEYYTEARYPFQVWGIELPLKGKKIYKKSIPEIVEEFESAHEERYGAQEPGQQVEFTHWRVVASGVMPKLDNPKRPAGSKSAAKAKKGQRRAYFKQLNDFIDANVYDGGALKPGNKIKGPAIIEEPGTTIVVPPKWEVTVSDRGDYMMSQD